MNIFIHVLFWIGLAHCIMITGTYFRGEVKNGAWSLPFMFFAAAAAAKYLFL